MRSPRPSLRLISPVARASWGKMALRRLDLPAPELPQKAVMPWAQGGFYLVRTPRQDLQCRGRGRFRKDSTQLLGLSVLVSFRSMPFSVIL